MRLFRSKSKVDTDGLSHYDADALIEATLAVDKYPHDLRRRRHLADTLVRLSRRREAIGHYEAIVGAFAAQGLLFRAIAVCKVILELDPQNHETIETLAKLYAQQDASAENAVASLPRSMSAALSQEGEAVAVDDISEVADVSDADVSDTGATVDDDIIDADDVIDADTLAAVTVRPEGSVTLARPQAVPLFSGLSPERFTELVTALRCWSADPGAVIVSEGERGSSVFVIASGAVVVERAGPDGSVVEVARLGAGDFFGEIAIIADRPRAATVTATRQTQLLEVEREILDGLVAKDPRVRDVLDGFCTRRLLASTLLTSSVWADLDQDIVARTLQRFEALTVPAGHVLIEQGKETPGLFVILGGNVDVVAAAEIGHVRLKQLGAGDVCGEMGLMSGKAASARCVTTSPTRAAVLSQAALHELATALPALAERLAALASARAAFNEHFLPADIARVGAL